MQGSKVMDPLDIGEITTRNIAQLLAGRYEGPDLKVGRLVAINNHDCDTIVPLLNPKYLKPIKKVQGVVLTTEILYRKYNDHFESAIVVDDTVTALATLIDLFYPPPKRAVGIHKTAVVSQQAKVDYSVAVGPGAVIEDGVVIKAGGVIGANSVICAGTKIGKYVQIGPNAVIGHSGFGFAPRGDEIVTVRQVGHVEIGDYVDIGAATCIDRGTLGPTVVEDGACIDNLVQIGHNCRIGKNVIIAAQSGIAGSTVIEDSVVMGGQVGVADHLTIRQGAMVGAKSGVTRNVAPGEMISGYPAMSRWQWLRVIAKLKR